MIAFYFLNRQCQHINMGLTDKLEWNTLLNYTEDGLIIVDRDYHIVAYNEFFKTYYRRFFNVELPLGGDILDYALNGRDRLKAVYDRVFAGERLEYNVEMTDPAGLTSHYRLVYKPASAASSQIDHVLVFVLDVSSEVNARIEIEKSEKQLKQERNVLRAIIDNIPEYIYVKNTKGEHVVNNIKIYNELLGFETEEESLGKTVYDYFGDILAADYQDDDLRIMSTGDPIIEKEEFIIDQYGKKQWLSTTKIPLRDSQNNVYGLVGLSRNVTDRYYKNLEDSFRSDLLAALSDHQDINKSLREVVMAAATMSRAQAGEIWLKSRSKPVLYKLVDWCGDDQHSPLLSFDHIQFEQGEGLPGIVWKDMETVTINDLVKSPFFSEKELIRSSKLTCGVGVPIINEGELVGVMTLFSVEPELDQRRRLEILERHCPFIGIEILRKQSKDMLEHFVSKTPVVITTIGDDGYFKTVNPGFCALTGFSEEELTSQPFMSMVHPDDAESTKEVFSTMLQGAEVFSFINRYVSKSGNHIWIAWHTSPIPGDEGLYFGFGNDITELVESRDQLHDLNENLKGRNKELAVMNNELEQFVYIASHDLQEPLRMITSFLSLLEKRIGEHLDEKSRQYIHFATDGAARMRSLILDLLKYSRVGREVTLKEFVDLGQLLKEVVNLNMPLLNEHHVSLNIGNLPNVYGIKSALFQLFQNLIQNAVKYRKPGVSPKVSIEGEEHDTYWKFMVKDNGIGIDDRYFDKIFIIFQRLHTREEYTGTGIGLAICKKVIEYHKGKIWVESVVGEGSTFYFTIAKDQR